MIGRAVAGYVGTGITGTPVPLPIGYPGTGTTGTPVPLPAGYSTLLGPVGYNGVGTIV